MKVDRLIAGEVGYLAASIKSVADARVGDTITSKKHGATKALPGILPPAFTRFCRLKKSSQKNQAGVAWQSPRALLQLLNLHIVLRKSIGESFGRDAKRCWSKQCCLQVLACELFKKSPQVQVWASSIGIAVPMRLGLSLPLIAFPKFAALSI